MTKIARKGIITYPLFAACRRYTYGVFVPFAAGKFQHQSLWPDTAARAMPAFERGAKKETEKKRKTTNNRHLYHYCRECEEK